MLELRDHEHLTFYCVVENRQTKHNNLTNCDLGPQSLQGFMAHSHSVVGYNF